MNPFLKDKNLSVTSFELGPRDLEIFSRWRLGFLLDSYRYGVGVFYEVSSETEGWLRLCLPRSYPKTAILLQTVNHWS